MDILRSKTFIGLSTTAIGIASVIAYDKKLTRDCKARLIEEAEKYGSQRLSPNGPQVATVFLTAAHADQLRKARYNWRHYAAEILTKGGVDYTLVETNLGEIDRRLFESRSVPDGVIIDMSAKPPGDFDAERWILNSVQEWLSIDKPLKSSDPEFDDFWKKHHPQKPKGFDPKSTVCLDKLSKEVLSKSHVKDLENSIFIPCVPSESFWMRIIDNVLEYPRASLVGERVIKLLRLMNSS